MFIVSANKKVILSRNVCSFLCTHQRSVAWTWSPCGPALIEARGGLMTAIGSSVLSLVSLIILLRKPQWASTSLDAQTSPTGNLTKDFEASPLFPQTLGPSSSPPSRKDTSLTMSLLPEWLDVRNETFRAFMYIFFTKFQGCYRICMLVKALFNNVIDQLLYNNMVLCA